MMSEGSENESSNGVDEGVDSEMDRSIGSSNPELAGMSDIGCYVK